MSTWRSKEEKPYLRLTSIYRSSSLKLPPKADLVASRMPQHTLQMLLESSLDIQTADSDGKERGNKSEDKRTQILNFYFNPPIEPSSQSHVSSVLADSASLFQECAYFGRIIRSESSGCNDIFLNTHDPFCFVTVGTQGAGKSHTMCCLLEGCLIPTPQPSGREIVRLHRPMASLMFHYEQNQSSVCEATGLTCPLPAVKHMFQGLPPVLPRENLIILVSPSYYHQRKAFYGDYCQVKPLLFPWASLSADHIKRIMLVNESDTQLYMAALLNLLRKYQRDCVVPSFQGFLQEITDLCSQNKSQTSPLQQRIALLESLVAESHLNSAIRAEGGDLTSCIGPGVLVIADLTDPLLSSKEANGIFQVLTEQFRTCHIPSGCGKLLALDEAHKFMRGDQSDGLSLSIVSAVRLMRHDGLRVAISTQSPLTLAPELLELVSIAVLHRFHSRSWFSYLSGKIPLREENWEEILDLPTGTGLVFASHHELGRGRPLKIAIRPRLTADRGMSKRNTLLSRSEMVTKTDA